MLGGVDAMLHDSEPPTFLVFLGASTKRAFLYIERLTGGTSSSL